MGWSRRDAAIWTSANVVTAVRNLRTCSCPAELGLSGSSSVGRGYMFRSVTRVGRLRFRVLVFLVSRQVQIGPSPFTKLVCL